MGLCYTDGVKDLNIALSKSHFFRFFIVREVVSEKRGLVVR